MNEHLRFQELAARSMDGDLAAGDGHRLQAHLVTCADCRRFAAGLSEDEALARARWRPHAPAAVREAVITAAFEPATRPRARSVAPVLGALVVTLVLLAGLGIAARLRTQEAAQSPLRSWTPLGDVAPFADARVTDVLATGANIIAAGAIVHGPDAGPAGWLSPDGLAWTRMPAGMTPPGGLPVAIAVHGDTIVALVSHQPEGSGMPPVELRAWVAHGIRTCDSCPNLPTSNPWVPARTDFPAPGDTTPVFQMFTAGDHGFVAVGTESASPELAPEGPFVGARVATSGDGSTWTFNDPMAAEFVGGQMLDVADGSAGIVAVGQTMLAPAVWFSRDGTTWTRLPGAIGESTASVRSVAAGPSGFVAVGDDGGSARAWRSEDGTHWREVPADRNLEDARMLLVRWLGSEFVAAGESGSDAVVWHSSDGERWERFDTGSALRGVSVARIAAIRDRYLLFGEPNDVVPPDLPPVVVIIGEPATQP